MDAVKCDALKVDLAAQPPPQMISIERYFDGNDDTASIGCNLTNHPGMDTFRCILTDLIKRADVDAVYALIEELDPGEDMWPFTDTVLVFGKISPDELQTILKPLQPDEVGPASSFGVPDAILARHQSVALAAWWD